MPGIGSRESGVGKAVGVMLTVKCQSVRALLSANPDSRLPIPGSARSNA
jgi:hypothetical protein